MSVDDILDIAAAVCLFLAAVLSLAAGVGLVRFPDALSRMHAATKPQILGLIFVVIAIALESREWATLLLVIPIVLFQMLTAPISAHMVGRAGYRTGNFDKETLVVDELESAIERAAELRAEYSQTRIPALVDCAALGAALKEPITADTTLTALVETVRASADLGGHGREGRELNAVLRLAHAAQGRL